MTDIKDDDDDWPACQCCTCVECIHWVGRCGYGFIEPQQQGVRYAQHCDFFYPLN